MVLSLVGQGAPWHWRVRAFAVAAFKMLRALASGPVPASVWRDRMRVCLRCPIYDQKLKACRKVMPSVGRILGCFCFVPYLALTAAPYEHGCWVHEITDGEGWPIYRFHSRKAKIKAVWRFICNKKEIIQPPIPKPKEPMCYDIGEL